MDAWELDGLLTFLRSAERLKDTLRSSHTSSGRTESVAEHTWRLCLMAVLLRHEFPDVDFTKLIRICVVHDLGEAIGGDIPAVDQAASAPKSAQERRDLLQLLDPLPERLRAELVELWDEYETAATAEARLAKALDKLETIMQHNQGLNPADFDYRFNLDYGQKYTADLPLISAFRAALDRETQRRADESQADASCARTAPSRKTPRVVLRPEQSGDAEAIHAVHTASFPTAAEAQLVSLLRMAGHLSVSLVAQADGAIIGHVAFSPVSAVTGAIGAGLAPVAVLDSYRRHGIAARLIEAGLAACRSAGFGWAVVLGDPAYYSRFGFHTAATFGLSDEYSGGPAFQAVELVPGTLPTGAGQVRYAPEFASLG